MKVIALAISVFFFYISGANAKDYVLTITIDQYAAGSNLPILEGVVQDRKSAIKIAESLGFNTTNAIQLQNQQATLEGVKNAFSKLEQSILGGDNVFFYYSGHGGTKKVENACQSSLVTFDNEDFLSADIYEYLIKIKNKSPAKFFVMLDSCHSGEFVDRGSKTKSISGSVWKPKFRTKAKDGSASCNNPINIVEVKLDDFAKSKKNTKGVFNEQLSGRMVMLSAARANEVAWDNSDLGGAATTATLACLNGNTLQSNESNGFISAEALRLCAQSKINNDQTSSIRQHMVSHGEVTSPIAPVLKPNSEMPASASKTLEALAQSANPTWGVKIEPFVGSGYRGDSKLDFNWSNNARIKIGGKHELQVTVKSERSGYLYLLYASKNSNKFETLFPTANENNLVKIAENEPLTIPYSWPANGNDGYPEQDTILAIVSEQPRPDLMKYAKGLSNAGIAANIAVAVTTPCKSLGRATSTCYSASNSDLPPTTTSSIQNYGAAGFVLDEY